MSEMSYRLLVGSPLAKEIENFAGNRCCGDSQSPGKIRKNRLTVPPMQEQASSPSQWDRPLPHLFRVDPVSPAGQPQNRAADLLGMKAILADVLKIFFGVLQIRFADLKNFIKLFLNLKNFID